MATPAVATIVAIAPIVMMATPMNLLDSVRAVISGRELIENSTGDRSGLGRTGGENAGDEACCSAQGDYPSHC
jgi:hypothetical protein